METYRPQTNATEGPRKLLLPLSRGVSSNVLLYILNQHLQRQLSNGRGRTAYELHVVVVDTAVDHVTDPTSEDLVPFEKTYPMHTFSAISLGDILDFDPDIQNTLAQLGVETVSVECAPQSSQRLDHMLRSIVSPTAKSDILEVLLIRLIVSFAKLKECESILWGHSNSRLASVALANVAKGRGASLPYHTSDGVSPWGINFTYPLRELFKAELVSYSNLVPSLHDLVSSESTSKPSMVSIKNTSIDDLMTQYISSQGEKYPSLMANVVRTVGKLQPMQNLESKDICALCGMAAVVDQDRTGTGKVDNHATSGTGHRTGPYLCYGCSRSALDIR